MLSDALPVSTVLDNADVVKKLAWARLGPASIFLGPSSTLCYTSSHVIHASLHALQGRASEIFPMDEAARKLRARPGVHIPSVSPGTLNKLLKTFAEVGSSTWWLQALSESANRAEFTVPGRSGEGGGPLVVPVTPCLHAFLQAVGRELQSCLAPIIYLQQVNDSLARRSRVHGNTPSCRPLSLMSAWEACQKPMAAIKYLFQVALETVSSLQGGAPEVSSRLLEALHDILVALYLQSGPSDASQVALLTRLLLSSLVPLMDGLQAWLADGTVQVPLPDFFVECVAQLEVTDKRFWWEAYKLAERRSTPAGASTSSTSTTSAHQRIACPKFLQPCAQAVLTAGKSLRLMRCRSTGAAAAQSAGVAGSEQHDLGDGIEDDVPFAGKTMMQAVIAKVNELSENEPTVSISHNAPLSFIPTQPSSMFNLMALAGEAPPSSPATWLHGPSPPWAYTKPCALYGSTCTAADASAMCSEPVDLVTPSKADLAGKARAAWHVYSPNSTLEYLSSEGSEEGKPSEPGSPSRGGQGAVGPQVEEGKTELGVGSLLGGLQQAQALFSIGVGMVERSGRELRPRSQNNMLRQLQSQLEGLTTHNTGQTGIAWQTSSVLIPSPSSTPNPLPSSRAPPQLLPHPASYQDAVESLNRGLRPNLGQTHRAQEKESDWGSGLPPVHVLIQGSLLPVINERVSTLGDRLLRCLLSRGGLVAELAQLRSLYMLSSPSTVEWAHAVLMNMANGNKLSNITIQSWESVLQAALTHGASSAELPSSDSVSLFVDLEKEIRAAKAMIGDRPQLQTGTNFSRWSVPPGRSVLELEPLTLSVTPTWLLSAICNNNTLKSYNKVFVFLLQVVWARDWVYRVRVAMMKAREAPARRGPGATPGLPAGASGKIRFLSMLEQEVVVMEMVEVVNALHNHLMNKLLNSAWAELVQALDQARSLDDVQVAHNTYLSSCLRICCVYDTQPGLAPSTAAAGSSGTSAAQPSGGAAGAAGADGTTAEASAPGGTWRHIGVAVKKLLDQVLRFCAVKELMMRTTQEVRDGFVATPPLAVIQEQHLALAEAAASFRDRLRYVLTVIARIGSKASVSDDLDQLLMLLNYNGYYDRLLRGVQGLGSVS